jgi:hypothetical protein
MVYVLNTVSLILRDEHRSGLFVNGTVNGKDGLPKRESNLGEGKVI